VQLFYKQFESRGIQGSYNAKNPQIAAKQAKNFARNKCLTPVTNRFHY